ncbi:MAG: ATPase [Massilia sp.]|nr:ATPase [Massilia sp.]
MISIQKELTIDVSQETAFKVFCQQMDLWWPRSHHAGKTPMVKMVLEPKGKGRWYSTHQDGEECKIGFIQDFEPNSRLVLVWQLNGKFAHDPALHTEVELNFIVQDSQHTRVTFAHRNLETLGKAVEGMNQGWGMILDLFSALANNGKLDGEALGLYQRATVDQ